ncbi:MAG: bifunctional diaminohydroxyphosphoribosylaminopyrimidine deaminase/5-amino-6-(5-phosphoribosylamino)uracil reductase RibD [Ignavibacteriaceae bacterium]|nr:bifunctional diaminohydroxyphosphoribosylaminopyrimidine deaminase/5-amino-6-(5-phosphoribosylamino)uracil reductase RibD [Ignavibacteriaceae bacterium]
MTDEDYLRLCFELAEKGRGSVSPNPLVGCVIVKNGKIIGEGFHQKYGSSHAEIEAFRSCSEDPEGAALYVNLEPCSHHGKTPPCADEIIRKKIARVVVSLVDPNPLVKGRGLKKLNDHGIETVSGILEKEGRMLNEQFIKFISENKPFVALKTAQTIDGRIADSSGSSKWLTNEESRKYVHRLRSGYDAVMVGSGTLLADDPSLNVRHHDGRDPYRIVLDTKLRIDHKSNFCRLAPDGRSVVMTSESNLSTEKARKLIQEGVKIFGFETDTAGRLPLGQILSQLYTLDIASVLVEGGAELFTSFISNQLADKLYIFVSPKILNNGISAFRGKDLSNLENAPQFTLAGTEVFGDDVLLIYNKK